MQDTIFALSSGHLPSSVAVIRLSGPKVEEVIRALCGDLPVSRVASYRTLKTKSGDVIDKGLVLFFPSPQSFTGEDVAEFHLHGSKAVLNRMLSELSHWSLLRHAEAGEFTKRAFLNGKLDLPEAEALSDLIYAETDLQRQFALQNMEGNQGRLYKSWRARILHARAHVEAELDFTDEQDVLPDSSIWQDMACLVEEIENYVKGFRRAEMIRSGYDVVIVGAPNSGKSSFMNRLANREVAIVSEEPGTTRDLIEVHLDLNGIKICLVDTAGLRDDAGYVESLGIERAKKRAREAHLVLELQDMTSSSPPVFTDRCPDLVVGSKLDLLSLQPVKHTFTVSSLTGEGIDRILKEIEMKARYAIGEKMDILPSCLRHVELLSSGLELILDAIREKDLELKAEFLRNAADMLARILGKIDAEDILEAVFKRFCIGK